MLGLRLIHVSKKRPPVYNIFWDLASANFENSMTLVLLRVDVHDWIVPESERRSDSKYCIVRFPLKITGPLQWRHNGRHGVSNHQPHDCSLKRLFRRRSKETSQIRVTGLYAANSSMTGEFPAHRAGNTENVSIWWRHHAQQYSIPLINLRVWGVWEFANRLHAVQQHVGV